MRLFIMRHGEASFDAPSDNLRPLTPGGVEQARQVALASREEIGSQPELWVSHLLRAQQTAAELSTALSITAQEQSFLGPDADPDRVLRALSKLDESATVVLVSHQPLVGTLVSLLCHGHSYEPHPYVTAEMLCLECPVAERGLAELKKSWRPE